MSKLLYFLSNTDQEIIAQCDHRSILQQKVKGFIILVCGLYVALVFAIGTPFTSKPLSIVLGLIFGLMVVSFYKHLVSSITIYPALISLVFVIFIGVIISVPIELKLFEERIKEEILKERMAEPNRQIWERENKIEEHRRELQELQKELIAENTGEGGSRMPGEGPRYQNKLKIYEDFKAETEKTIALLSYEIEQIRHIRDTLNVSSSDDFLARLVTLQKLQSTSPSINRVVWLLRLMSILTLVLPVFAHLLEGNTKYVQLMKEHQARALDDEYERVVTVNSRLQIPDFGHGYASAIDWTAALSPTGEELRRGKTSDEADEAALAGDWKAVGKDLKKVLNKYEPKST